MAVLNVLLAHLGPEAVEAYLAYLARIAPGSRFAVAHGGRREDFDALGHEEKVFVDDPTLRGPPRTFQSYHVTLGAVHEALVRDDPTVDAVYVFEWDHLLLRGDVERELADIAERTGADLLGKGAVVRNGTNWHHYGRFRRDGALLAHLRALSVRDEPTTLYGMLGDGFWMRRPALEAYVAVRDRPPCYGELYVPTVLYHLGFRVVDVDTYSDLYRHVRFQPVRTLDEVIAIKAAGGGHVHPFKDLGALERILAAPGPVVPEAAR